MSEIENPVFETAAENMGTFLQGLLDRHFASPEMLLYKKTKPAETADSIDVALLAGHDLLRDGTIERGLFTFSDLVAKAVETAKKGNFKTMDGLYALARKVKFEDDPSNQLNSTFAWLTVDNFAEWEKALNQNRF